MRKISTAAEITSASKVVVEIWTFPVRYTRILTCWWPTIRTLRKGTWRDFFALKSSRKANQTFFEQEIHSYGVHKRSEAAAVMLAQIYDYSATTARNPKINRSANTFWL